MNGSMELLSNWILDHIWWVYLISAGSVVLAAGLRPWKIKGTSKPRMLLYLILAEIAVPTVMAIRDSTSQGPLELALWTAIALNVSWLVASGFDPMGPFILNDSDEGEEGSYLRYLWYYNRKPILIFWPLGVVGVICILLLAPNSVVTLL